MGLKTTIAKASTVVNSFRTTVPAAVMSQFDLKVGDKLDWTFKSESGKLVLVVKPEKKD